MRGEIRTPVRRGDAGPGNAHGSIHEVEIEKKPRRDFYNQQGDMSNCLAAALGAALVVSRRPEGDRYTAEEEARS